MLRLVLENLLSNALENMCTRGQAMTEIGQTSDEYGMMFFAPDSREEFGVQCLTGYPKCSGVCTARKCSKVPV